MANVRFVHYYPSALGASGVTVALWAWAGALALAGHEVLVLHAGSSDNPWSIDQFAPAGVHATPEVRRQIVPHRGRGRTSLRPVGLGRFLGRGDLLVLHEGWVTCNLVAAREARRAGVPYIVMPHGVYARLWRRYLKGPLVIREAFERRLLERALAVHLFFPAEAADVTELASGASVITAPTGFELPAERWSGGGNYLAWVGRYDPINKGLDMLIEAVASLPPERRPRIALRGYDYKGGEQTLRRMIARLGVGAWIEMGGVVLGKERTAFLTTARGCIHPSRWESYGLALVENLALGAPCLVSSTVAMSSELRRYDAALLASPDPTDFAGGLLKLVEGTVAGMGERARTFVGQELAWDKCLATYLGELRRVGLG